MTDLKNIFKTFFSVDVNTIEEAKLIENKNQAKTTLKESVITLKSAIKDKNVDLARQTFMSLVESNEVVGDESIKQIEEKIANVLNEAEPNFSELDDFVVGPQSDEHPMADIPQDDIDAANDSGKIIRTSYEIVTPESAEEGDFEDTGWEDEEGQKFNNTFEAVNFLKDKGAMHASSSQFHPGIWYSTESQSDLQTGEEKTYSFHLDGFTEEEQKEIYEAIINGVEIQDPDLLDDGQGPDIQTESATEVVDGVQASDSQNTEQTAFEMGFEEAKKHYKKIMESETAPKAYCESIVESQLAEKSYRFVEQWKQGFNEGIKYCQKIDEYKNPQPKQSA